MKMPERLQKKLRDPRVAEAWKRGIDVKNVPYPELGSAMSAQCVRSRRSDGRSQAMLDLIERGLATKGRKIVVSTEDGRNIPVVVVRMTDCHLIVSPIVNGQRSAQKCRVLPVHVVGPAPD